ncbi:hypothetical protein LguiB_030781 [Lonicera macranthoides]
MNHCVPDFEIDEEYSIPTSSVGLIRPKKSSMPEEEEIMELLWQNGQVVVQSQNQRSLRKSHRGEAQFSIPPEQSSGREFRSDEETTATHLFMQEDEMASWLHYPLDDSPFDRDMYSDLLYPDKCAPVAPPPSRTTPEVRLPEVRPPPQSSVALAPRPPVPPTKRLEAESSGLRYQNLLNLSRPKGSTVKSATESTVVDSNDMPVTGPESRVSQMADNTAQVSGGNIGPGTMSGAVIAGKSSAGRDSAACELTVTSSPGGSGTSVSASPEPSQKPPTAAEDRKRKGREGDDSECHSEGVEFESADAKKQARGSTSAKRSRAAEVHNLSERRRRDRINEKMKALQELIPGCNKSDKASMLDEAIEYLKSLQVQVQMMSMGCSMVPVMFPGVQQYMPPMAMGMGMNMGMGMGMGMDMSMNRSLVPFPSVLPGSAMQNPSAAVAHMAPRFPMPPFHMQLAPGPDPSRIQPSNQTDPMPNSLVSQNPNYPRISNFTNPYQQYAGLHQAQVPLPQNQAVVQSNTTKPSISREVGNSENHQSG